MSESVAILARISVADGDDTDGVDRQLRAGRAWAARAGHDVAAEIANVNLSAFAVGGQRPDLDEVQRLAAAGQVSMLWARDVARLSRRNEVLDAFLRMLDAHGVRLVIGQTERALDERGRLQLRREGIDQEIVTIENRANALAALDDNARAGQRHGRVPYGWDHRGQLVSEQAAVVAEMVQRVAAGVGVRTVAADLNTRGVPRPGGQPWDRIAVRQIVLRASNAGLRQHRGQLLDGVDGAWEPIVTRDLWEVAQAGLLRKRNHRSPRSYLLTGLISTDDGQPMSGVRVKLASGRDAVRYRSYDGTTSILAGPVDDIVAQAAVGILARVGAGIGEAIDAEGDGERAELADRVTAARARIDATEAAVIAGDLDPALGGRAAKAARAELATAQDALRDATGNAGHVLAPFADADPAQVWDAMNLDERRAVLGVLFGGVLVAGFTPGFRADAADRVTLLPRQRVAAA